MELKKLTEHIWYMPFEEERDRPNLGYVKGDKLSLAIDAGHSEAHVKEFYDLLQKEGLPLPTLTVLTHWHWDHTFAMHAVNGLTIANKTTNGHLLECITKIEKNGPEAFLNLYDSIRKEYAGGKEMIVIPADIVFEGSMKINLGGCTISTFQSAAPHTDDSTLVYVCEDKTLFVGDAACSQFPDGARDIILAKELADKIRSTGAITCVEGHWQPVDTEDTLRDLLN
ncbi:MAG: MBL fold metallo-hydrolase [Lachnospiraceae bacterium]|nr:MBL fold metallo-hydrolase [Lachnospiraceae bacterium]